MAFFCSGCREGVRLWPEKPRVQAEKALAAGDVDRAIVCYEEGLDGSAEAAELHYSLGMIYYDKKDDPISALHHFQRYLDLAPSGSRREEAKKAMARMELTLASKLASSGLMTRDQGARLKNENLELRKQLAQVHGQPAPAGAQPPRDARGFSKVPATAAAEKLVGAETRTYTVGKGDTLASISRKFYKTTQRWKDIADANQNALGGSVNLKVGQVLIIP